MTDKYAIGYQTHAGGDIKLICGAVGDEPMYYLAGEFIPTNLVRQYTREGAIRAHNESTSQALIIRWADINTSCPRPIEISELRAEQDGYNG